MFPAIGHGNVGSQYLTRTSFVWQAKSPNFKIVKY